MSKQINIDLIIKSKKWNAIADIDKFIAKTCQKLLLLTDLQPFLQRKSNYIEIMISLVSDSQIKRINQQFRNKNKATDILSFPFYDKKTLKNPPQHLFLGDIIIAFETIKKEAINSQKDFHDHLTHLLLHSLLHLLGYDHEKSREAKIMENREIEILTKIGIKNPYKPI